VRQLTAAAVVVDDDRAQARALDDGRLVAVERDADAQCARAVQELAGDRDRERELLAFRQRRQLGFVAVSCPRMAPAPKAALWMFT
jgi:hypothetical protein